MRIPDIIIFSERRINIEDTSPSTRILSKVIERFQLVGPPGIGPGLHDPQPCVLPLYDGPQGGIISEFILIWSDRPGRSFAFGPFSSDVLCRAVENRTRSTSSRRMRTTGILRPDMVTTLARFRSRPLRSRHRSGLHSRTQSAAGQISCRLCTLYDSNVWPFACEANALTN